MSTDQLNRTYDPDQMIEASESDFRTLRVIQKRVAMMLESVHYSNELDMRDLEDAIKQLTIIKDTI